jgi:cobaltochelatase CobT
LAETVKSTIQKRDDKGIIRHGAEWLTIWSDPDSLKTGAEMRAEAAAHRERIEMEYRLAAAARSVSGNPELQIVFGADGRAADLPPLPALRGEIDSYALIQRFHSPAVHHDLAPAEPGARRLFDLCEHVRCEAVGAQRFPGIRENLVAHQLERLRKSNLLNAHLASLVPLAEGLRMVLRDALLEAAEPSIDSQAFWMWHQWLRARFSQDLHALRLTQQDQLSYASISLAFIEKLLKELGSDEGRKRRFEPSGSESGEAVEDGGDLLDAERMREDPAGDVFQPGGDLFLEEHPKPFAAPVNDAASPAPYAVFTTSHDRVARPTDLVDPAALRKSRLDLDRRRADFRRDFAHLVTRLQRRLLARQMRNWSFDLDEGLIDASRLDRVIVNPGFASAYKQEQESEFRDSVVSILIDNSGSMRGKPIEIACLASDMISAALERCAVACEILGFTTSGWKGGNSARDWARAGRPKDPGRLNDLLHIVYKSADEPVRRSRAHVCAMLETALLKENIDGEALLWAWRRLLTRPESRKVLIVISDGAPVDQATLEHNADKAILDRHLRGVIAAIEASRSIELTAIGVKHDVGRYYRNSVQIDKVENLGASLVAMVDTLLSR